MSRVEGVPGGEPEASPTKHFDKYCWPGILDLPLDIDFLEKIEDFSGAGIGYTITQMFAPEAEGDATEELALRRLVIAAVKKQAAERGKPAIKHLQQFLDQGEVMKRVILDIISKTVEPWINKAEGGIRYKLEEDQKYQTANCKP